MCDRPDFIRSSHIKGIDIHGASVTLAEEIDRVSVGRYDRIAVFTGMRGQISMPTGLCVIFPYVTCHRRCVMLTPYILHTLLVLIQETFAIRQI